MTSAALLLGGMCAGAVLALAACAMWAIRNNPYR